MTGFLSDINFVSAALIILFAAPVLIGFAATLTKEKMSGSINSLLDNIELIVCILLSVYFTKKIFFEHDGDFFGAIYGIIPISIRNMLFQQDVLTYLLAVPILMFIILLIIRLLTKPLYNKLILPLSEYLYKSIARKSMGIRRLAGALWQVPKALVLTLLFAFLLNFASYYLYSPLLSKWAADSKVYQVICSNVIYPVINSNIAKKVPVLLNDSFSSTISAIVPGVSTIEPSQAAEAIERLSGGNITVIEYFNGVTIDDAVKSSPEIDQKALEIIRNAESQREKAYMLYQWICSNIEYDYEKAERIVIDSSNEISGSLTAFKDRSGICFDYSCLYISMCRAAGLKVRLITGTAYSGVTWGDHAWNQVYDPDKEEWINVDATFGSSGVNYFGKEDFYSDHRNEDIQGEW